MTSISIDGLPEEEFRRAIEGDLRHGRENAAAARLRKLLEPYAGEGRILPERFLTVTPEDLSLRGWEYLGDCIARHDRPGRPVTALSIAFGWPGDEVPPVGEDGCLEPHLETGYFNDAAYPFSQSGRDDLLDGYSLHGCTWAADCEAVDNALSLAGADDLNGALALLEARLLASEEPDPDEIRAGSLGACLLSVLLFQAVGQRIAKDGLPRPLCITAGSNGVYPYFDAPVVGMPEHVRRAAAEAEDEETEVDAGIPGPRYSSLLLTGIPRAQKRAVLVLAETESETALRIARLRGHEEAAEQAPTDEPEPEPRIEEVAEARPAMHAPGLLLTKKPSGQHWDLREMLGPRPSEPDHEPEGAEPARPPQLPRFAPEPPPEPVPALAAAQLLKERAPRLDEPVAEPALPVEVAPAPDPAPDPAPLPALADEVPLDQPAPLPDLSAPPPDAAPEPGFPLLAESLQQRLESLLVPGVSLLEPAPAVAPCEPARPVPAGWRPDQAGPIWPFGFAWEEAAGEVVESSRAPVEEPPLRARRAPGLWERLRAWARPRRR